MYKKEDYRITNRGSAVMVVILVVMIAVLALLVTKQYKNHKLTQNKGGVAAVYETATELSLAKSQQANQILITDTESAKKAVSTLRLLSSPTSVRSDSVSADYSYNLLLAEGLEQFIGISAPQTKTSNVSTKSVSTYDVGSTKPSTSASPVVTWPAGLSVSILIEQGSASEVRISTPDCIRIFAGKSKVKTNKGFSAALKDLREHGGFCLSLATAQSIILTLGLPTSEWSNDNGKTISPGFISKVDAGAGPIPEGVHGRPAAAGKAMHEKFVNSKKTFVCDKKEVDLADGHANLCKYIKDGLTAGKDCEIYFGHADHSKGHLMNLKDAVIGPNGECLVTTYDSGNQGDDQGKNIPAPSAAATQQWSLKNGASSHNLVDGVPALSDKEKEFWNGKKFQTASTWCCAPQAK